MRQDLESQPPVFILGHWRSGTTHLHYMMARDPRFGFLTNYQSYFFNIAFLTRSWLKPLLRGLFPNTRPMDNMAISPDLPGEEEQPLVGTTARSGLHSLFFPHNLTYLDKYNFHKGVTDEEISKWKEAFLYVVKTISCYTGGKPLVLKNPHNTSRVKVLLELFPNAKFIFPHRNPYDVYRSTIKLYHTIIRSQMLQEFTDEQIEEQVLYLFRETMQKYLAERELIPEGNLVELAFQDLEADPMACMTQIYQGLSLPGFEQARPGIQAYLDSVKGYQKNRFAELPAPLRARINAEWDFYFQEFAYPKR